MYTQLRTAAPHHMLTIALCLVHDGGMLCDSIEIAETALKLVSPAKQAANAIPSLIMVSSCGAYFHQARCGLLQPGWHQS